jgi:hypothetical protein
MPESQPDIDVGGKDTESQDRVRQLHEQLLQGDVLEVLGYERGKISELLQKDKRSEVFQRLIERREEIFPGIEEKQLQDDLNTLNEYLDELDYMQRALVDYKRSNQSPEKAGMLRSAFESVKRFAKNHPVVVTLLAGAAALGGVYLAWSYLGGIIPVPNVMEGAAGVADSVAAPTGGAFEAIPQGEIVGPNMFPPSASGELPLPPAPTGTQADLYPPGAPR